MPIGQKVILLNYNLFYGDRLDQSSQITYSLFVKVNGSLVKMIASEVPVTSSMFSGTEASCTEAPSLPYCFYTKNFEVPIDVSSFTGNAPAQIQVFMGAQSSNPEYNDGFILNGGIYYNFRFALTQTNFSFQPRDARDSVSDCGNPLHTYNCYPEFKVGFVKIVNITPGSSPSYYPVEPYGKIRFRLKFQKPHLRGTSSNQGSGMEPDYLINPGLAPLEGQADGQQLFQFSPTTPAQALQSDGSYVVETSPLGTVDLKVTSMDFGGRARLYAEAIFDNGGSEIVVAAEAGEIIDWLFTPADVPTCVADTVLKFATLPLDNDCDDIADSWEAEVGQITNSEDDAEPGPGGQHVGDGYTAHDEYRGFHYTRQPSPTAAVEVAWTRTEPKQEKDVFYWDASNFAIRKNIDSILGHQGPALKFREVSEDQSNSLFQSNVELPWIDPLAKNSKHVSERQAFALVFVSRPLPVSNALIANSNGFRMIGLPVVYDVSRIASMAGNMGFSMEFLLAFVFGHEAGHQFGLFHPEREGCGKTFSCTYIPPPSPLTVLQMNQYSINPSNNNQMYIKIRYYPDPNLASRTWPEHSPFIMFGGDAVEGTSIPGFVQDTTGNLEHVDLVTFPSFYPLSNVTVVRVFEQINSLMDWTPSLKFVNPSSVKFTQDQAAGICVHGACGQ